MIRVNNDYVIDIEDDNYVVKFDRHCTVERKTKTGAIERKHYYSVIDYCPSLTSAIKKVIADMNRRELSNGVHTLEEALEIVIKNNRQVSELLEKALEV